MDDARDLLREGLKELGIEVVTKQADTFLLYLEELKKWNRAHNLTGLKTDREIVIKHFLDSLLFLKVLPPSARSVADVGSGAGFPGIPMKIIMPGIRLYLIESSLKKAVFLRHVCHLLSLENCTVISQRLEEVDELKVDAVVTRALYGAGEFVEKAARLLNEHGVLILSKGPKVGEESPGEKHYSLSVEPVILPLLKLKRNLITVHV